MRSFYRISAAVIFAAALFAATASAQVKTAGPANGPETKGAVSVVKVDDAGLREAMKPKDKPLVVNFWATWCAPCIEEFPDLVTIANEYRGKADVMTVSLDDVADIDKAVPDFLKRMKADMPAFLLVSADETELIGSINKDWSGGLPFTVVYDVSGKMAYFREGKFRPDVLRAEIDKAIASKTE